MVIIISFKDIISIINKMYKDAMGHTLNKRTPNCLYLSSSLAKNLAATGAISTPMMEAAFGEM